MIGGDFNARTGEWGGSVGAEEEEEDLGKNSKNKKVNKESWRLLEVIEDVGMEILNGSVTRDEKGKYTYVDSNKNTDYRLCDS